MFLVDANVLSESTRLAPSPKAVEWLRRNERKLLVDSIILGELQVGILSLVPGRKRTALESWFDSMINTIDCVPWDRSVSLRWAKLVSDLKRRGKRLPLLDSMVAATALTHNLTVATRNIRDFRAARVKVVDPFT